MHKHPWALSVAGGFLLGLALLTAGCSKHGAAASPESAKASKAAAKAAKTVMVTVSPVELRPVQRTVSVVGTLYGLETLQISSKVAGRIEKVGYDVGDRVPPGTVLAEIDQADFQLAVDEAQRALERELAKVGLTQVPDERFDPEQLPSVMRGRLLVENTKRQHERLRSLVERKASSIQEYEQAETDLRVEQAALRQVMLDIQATRASIRYAQSVLATAERQLSETQVLAPPLKFASMTETPDTTYVVSERHVTAGEFSNGMATPLFSLVVDDVLKLRVTVPERYASQVKTGLPVAVQVDAYPGEIFQATVARVSPTINPQSRTFVVEAHVPNTDHRLQSGGFAKAEVLIEAQSQAVTAPLESIVSFAGVTKVFCVIDGKAQEVPVATGMRGDGWVELIGEIDPQAVVVTSGQTQLTSGVSVAVRQALAPAQTASR